MSPRKPVPWVQTLNRKQLIALLELVTLEIHRRQSK